jgi:AraC-like DNA-binding protein
MTRTRDARPGTEHLAAKSLLTRHRHPRAYVALVLEGSYVERGDAGSWRVEAGDLLVHHAFDAHCNQVGHVGARVLNIHLAPPERTPAAVRLHQPDEWLRWALADAQAACRALVGMAQPQQATADWPDVLADQLRHNPATSVSAWARQARLSPAHVSRGFVAVYGVTPSRYRAEARAHHAMRQIVAGSARLAEVAQDCGFADQSHMTRAVVALTGRPPSSWRQAWRQVKCVQDSARPDN